MTPLERLLLEEIPTRPSPGVHSVWTKQDQDRHWADLAASVGVPNAKRPTPVHMSDVSEAAA
ncbi:hypothetical protein ACLVWQ_17680 (plasmid) [Streptomyces sp. CWNU-52B]|uniref:hypothetical protein n=1 Tax=unclassified Streptomyces TaxID=2593676 RepID=UPI0039C1958F